MATERKPIKWKAAAPLVSKVIEGESGASEAGWHKLVAGLRCLKEYQFAHVRGIRRPESHTPDYFAIGSMLHAGKARWFARNFATDVKTWASMQEAMLQECEKQKLPVSSQARARGERYMDEYVQHWSRQPLPTPVATEYLLGPTPLNPGDPKELHRTARLDDVSKYPEALYGLCIGETKTTSGTVNDCIKQYSLHGQPSMQMLLWKMDPLGERRFGPIVGVILDVVRKGEPGKRSSFHREFIPVSPFVQSWLGASLRGYLKAMAAIDWDSDAPRNIAMCTRMEGRARVGCDFQDLCLRGPSGTTKYVLQDGSSLQKHKPESGKERMPWE